MKAAVVGLDGASWHLLDPMIEAGVMPLLGEFKAGGASGPLRSTLPVFTPPAWTSALTGVNPGRHGIFGFFEGNAQSERQQLLHSGKVQAPLLWDLARAQDTRCGIFNLPLTYPAVEIDGWMLSGMMTPGEGAALSRWATPKRSGGLVLGAVPDYVPDLTANYETDYKSTRLCDAGLRILDHRRRALEALLDADEPDLLFAMIEVPDRLQHVYYAFLDPSGDRYDSPEGRRMRDAILPCYRRVDEIIGSLRARLGADGWLIVCSDHGFTRWEVSVHTNVLLAQWGYLTMRPGSRLLQSAPVKKAASAARRFLPHAVTRPAKQLSMNAIDWSRTQAFASPVQGVRLNLKGRERLGTVAPEDAPAV
ncbi:MAG: alkaline phosphatase family protein, partial [Actinomycetota bacterium]